MPSFNTYKQMMLQKGKTSGQLKQAQSEQVIETTWNEDTQSRICYIYDYYHDDEPDKNVNLNPIESSMKTAIDAKFLISSYNTMDKDTVAYKLQFRPSQENPLNYFEDYVEKYKVQFPIGLYVDIPDVKGIYQKWLIVGEADRYDSFETWFILPCDHLYQWVYTKDGIRKKYQMWGTSRSQNSYNQGVYLDYIIEKVENQKKCILPYNSDSQTLFYNQRLIISAPVDEGIQPTAWRVTKVENTNPVGTQRLTFAQDKFDQNHDYIERDNQGKVIGMWADYYSSTTPEENVVIEDNVVEDIHNVITFNGLNPQIKINGSYKTFTATYYDKFNQEQSAYIGNWSFYIDEINVMDLEENPLEIVTSEEDNTLANNQVKVKFIGDEDYIGQTLTVTNTLKLSTVVEAKLDMEITSL